MNKAIVTIIIGDKYKRLWGKYAENGWRSYCKKHGYDLIIIDEPLDNSDLAKSRSVAWQKCLVLSNSKVQHYDKVVWIDSDIQINTDEAPDIISFLPEGKIGCTDAYCFYTRETYSFLYDVLIKYWQKQGLNPLVNRTGNDYYLNFGIETTETDVVQTGVLILEPGNHQELMEYTYYNYEDKGSAEWNYEMRPLSYEIVRNQLHHFLDHRFNFGFDNFQKMFYPQIGQKKDGFFSLGNTKLLRQAASIAFANSYFLHFAGCQDLMKHTEVSKSSLNKFFS